MGASMNTHEDYVANGRPLFIGGHRKCGTSLFLRMLDSHPMLNVYPQDLITLYAYFPHFIDRDISTQAKKEMLFDVVFRDMDRAYDLGRTSFCKKIDLMKFYFEQYINRIDLSNILQVLTAQILAFKKGFHAEQGLYDVLKETSIEIYASYLLEQFSKGLFIHVVRDPRDNYAALKSGISEYYSKFGDTDGSVLMSLLHRYGIGMNMAFQNLKVFGEAKYKLVRHEDVVTNTEVTMRDVCIFLSIPFDNALLQPTAAGEIVQGNSFENHDMRKVNRINISRWRERITDQEACVIEFFFRENMERLGYECVFSRKEQIKAVSNFYKWSNYKYFYFDRFAETSTLVDL